MTLLRSALPLVLFLCAGCCCRMRHEVGVSPVSTVLMGPEGSHAPQEGSADIQAPSRAKSSSLISIDLAQSPLSAAISVLRSGSGANIVVSSRVYEERTPDELLVTVRLDDVTVETALTWITRLVRLQWYRQNDVLYVTVPGDVPSDVPTQVYPVHDLLGAPSAP